MPPILKRKEQPMQEQQPTQAPPKEIPQQGQTAGNLPIRINDEVDPRLNAFMTANSKDTAYYTRLVKENPDHAVRTLMLGKMFRFEAEQKVAERMAPGAREWFKEQSPEVRQRIVDRIEKVPEFYRKVAAVRIVGEEKTKLDFQPKEMPSQGLSI